LVYENASKEQLVHENASKEQLVSVTERLPNLGFVDVAWKILYNVKYCDVMI
jgi:hypothetical protein